MFLRQWQHNEIKNKAHKLPQKLKVKLKELLKYLHTNYRKN